jgi:hypothetical protein
MHLEDERMDPDVHDQRKLLAKRVSSNQHWLSVTLKQAPVHIPVF